MISDFTGLGIFKVALEQVCDCELRCPFYPAVSQVKAQNPQSTDTFSPFIFVFYSLGSAPMSMGIFLTEAVAGIAVVRMDFREMSLPLFV